MTSTKLKIFTTGMPHTRVFIRNISVKFHSQFCCPTSEVDRICKVINDQPFPSPETEISVSHNNKNPSFSLSPGVVENIMGRLFSGHANGLKAQHFFRWAAQQNPNPNFEHTTFAYERMLHILTRMRDFDRAWELLEEMRSKNKITRKAMGMILSAYAKIRSFDETLEAFERLENFVGNLDTDAFNVLLKAFCSHRNMKETRGMFYKMLHRFAPNRQTFNILLLGFKESGNAIAAEIFFREMGRRGFDPDIVSYNILIDALCKKKRIDDAFELVEVMKRKECKPNVLTYTTLIHGLGIVKNKRRAFQLCGEMKREGLEPDTAVYNALISCLCKSGDVDGGLMLMKEMEEKGVGCDDITYHTLLSVLQNLGKEQEICELFGTMVARDHVLKVSTVVILMKFFCSSGLHDMALKLWDYVVKKGSCPHGHVSNLLITELCYSGKLEEALDCFREILEKGLHPYRQSFEILQRFYREAHRESQLSELLGKMKRLQSCLPASAEYVSVFSEEEKDCIHGCAV